MKNYKKSKNCLDLIVKKKYNNVIWTERMNSMGRNRRLKVKKRQVAGLKGAFVICEVSSKLTNLKNSKDISDRELRLHPN